MDFLIDLREKYCKVRKYLEDDSKRDPETEPFHSKYKAHVILKDMREIIEHRLPLNENLMEQLECMLAVVLLQMAIIAVDTMEITRGQSLLEELMGLLKTKNEPKQLLIAITGMNQLGITNCNLGNTERSKIWLEQAEKLYNDFIANGDVESIMSLHDHFDNSCEISGSKGSDELEKMHTLTKFYLAQVYGTLGDKLKSAVYCHETLRRQLEIKDYQPIEWALNAATLSQFFMERHMFKQARHHLAAASYMMDRHLETTANLDVSDDELEAKKEEIRYRSADVALCWAKYGIALLEQWTLTVNGQDVELIEQESNDAELQDFWFSTVELAEYENQMPLIASPVHFEDARNLMVTSLRHLNSAKEYYTLEDHASDYVKIVQDHSTLLKHLSVFESDSTRLSKMLRKRITLLEDVLKELNPQYYLDVCRQLWFELGETYYDLVQIKSEKIKNVEGVPSPAILAKFNHLCEKSMQHFQHFLHSLRDKTSNELPEKYSEDLVRPALTAHFYLARLIYKIITPDKRMVLKNSKISRDYYKYIIDYCKKFPQHKVTMADELAIAEEMATLLNLKIIQAVNTL